MEDLCIRILVDHCIGILSVGQLVQDLCFKISARSLSQDLCVRILLDHLHQDLANESARHLRKLKTRASKRSVLYDTSLKTEDPDFQNECFMRDFHEN